MKHRYNVNVAHDSLSRNLWFSLILQRYVRVYFENGLNFGEKRTEQIFPQNQKHDLLFASVQALF